MRNSVILALVFVVTSACTRPGPPSSEDADGSDEGLTICADGPTVKGIDVAEFEGAIDWDEVKQSGIEFAFVRVSDGVDFPDDRFDQNWAGAKAAGVRRGAYQFFRGHKSPQVQAEYFLSKIGTLAPTDLPPVVDAEQQNGVSDSVFKARLKTWIDIVSDATGRRPIIYTAKYFWEGLGDGDTFAPYPLWVANYAVSCPKVPNTWDRWAFWQYSETGSVGGINSPVDLNRFNGTAADLDIFITESIVSLVTTADLSWQRSVNGTYSIEALAPPAAARVEYQVDGFAVGASSSAPFEIMYAFSSAKTARKIEAHVLDASNKLIAYGSGLIDTVPGTGIFIRSVGEDEYEIGLERAPTDVHAIEVRADGFLLTDGVSGESHSERLAVRSKFLTLGEREFVIDTFNADGTQRGTLRRTFDVE